MSFEFVSPRCQFIHKSFWKPLTEAQWLLVMESLPLSCILLHYPLHLRRQKLSTVSPCRLCQLSLFLVDDSWLRKWRCTYFLSCEMSSVSFSSKTTGTFLHFFLQQVVTLTKLYNVLSKRMTCFALNVLVIFACDVIGLTIFMQFFYFSQCSDVLAEFSTTFENYTAAVLATQQLPTYHCLLGLRTCHKFSLFFSKS